MFKDLFKSKEEKELTSKPQVLDCAMQPIISKDNICVKIAYAICYNVFDYKTYKNSTQNPKYAIEYFVIVTMRNVLGEYTANEISEDREKLAEIITDKVNEGVNKWGVKFSRVEMTRVEVPTEEQLEARRKEMAEPGYDAVEEVKKAIQAFEESKAELEKNRNASRFFGLKK